MAEANYSIDRDLQEAKAMADHLVPYVYEKELYGSIGGMFGSGTMPRLTIGALLLHLRRLRALEDKMTPEQQTLLNQIAARNEEVRKEWTIHYNEKLVQEANSRLKMIEQFFADCADEPRTCAGNYAPEALRRTIVQEIVDALDRANQANPDLDRAIHKTDTQLHRFTAPTDFIWSPSLAAAYPPDHYWWLYAKPPRVPVS